MYMCSVILEEAHVSVIMMYNWCSFLLKWLKHVYTCTHNCNHTKEYADSTTYTCAHINVLMYIYMYIYIIHVVVATMLAVYGSLVTED